MIQSIQTAYRGMSIESSRVEESARRLAGTEKLPGPLAPEAGAPAVAGGNNPAPPPSAVYLPDVDIPKELVNMKMAQKAYELNAKVAGTSAEMLKETFDIKV